MSGGAVMVELGFADGHVVRVPTFAGEAYTGTWAGRMRFILGETTIGPGIDSDPESVRMLDAAGAVIGVARAPVRARSARVLRRRAGGELVRATATLTSELAPLPGAPEQRQERTCVNVGSRPDRAWSPRWRARTLRRRCSSAASGARPRAVRADGVRPGRRRAGSTSSSAAGARSPCRRGRCPSDEQGGWWPRCPSGSTGAPPRDRRGRGRPRARPRRAARGPAGPALRRRPLRGLALPRRREPRLGVTPETQVAATLEQGGPRLLIRDAGERICVGVDRVELDDAACLAPRFSAHAASVYADLDRGLVAGGFPADVAEIELALRDGNGSIRLPAVEGTGYTGRYRSALHFVFARIPVGRAARPHHPVRRGGPLIGFAIATARRSTRG